MAAEENRFVTCIIPPFPVQERILRNKTWLDFSEIWWLFVINYSTRACWLSIISYPTRALGIIVNYNHSSILGEAPPCLPQEVKNCVWPAMGKSKNVDVTLRCIYLLSALVCI